VVVDVADVVAEVVGVVEVVGEVVADEVTVVLVVPVVVGVVVCDVVAVERLHVRKLPSAYATMALFNLSTVPSQLAASSPR